MIGARTRWAAWSAVVVTSAFLITAPMFAWSLPWRGGIPVSPLTAPSVTTKAATAITLGSATLNANLAAKGSNVSMGANASIVQIGHAYCSSSSCSVSLLRTSTAGNTILFITLTDGGLTSGPTDDGGNTWPCTACWYQSGFAAHILAYYISGATLPMKTVSWGHTSGNMGGALFELTPVNIYNPTESSIIGPPGWGVSIASVHENSIGQIVLSAPGCTGLSAYTGTIVDSFTRGTADCDYSLRNAGTQITLNGAGAGLYDGLALDFESAVPPTVATGFILSTQPNLSGGTNTTVASNAALGDFSLTPAGLRPSTTYYFAAWANATSYAQGSTLSFTTPAPSGGGPPGGGGGGAPPGAVDPCVQNPLSFSCIVNRTPVPLQQVCSLWFVVFAAIIVAVAAWVRRWAHSGPSPGAPQQKKVG